jgi:hypothetical protein
MKNKLYITSSERSEEGEVQQWAMSSSRPE